LSSPINLLLVDDHRMMLDGLRSMLRNEKKFRIVAETTRAEEVTDLILAHAIDMVVTDVGMPGIGGAELTRLIREKNPGLAVLALSMHLDRENVSAMIQAGVNGYVLKTAGREELLKAMETVADGGMYFSQEITLEMMKMLRNPEAEKPTEPVITLTARESEIVRMMAADNTNAQIGEKLFISERTVETHRKNIFRKTGTKTVAGLMRFAMEKQWI